MFLSVEDGLILGPICWLFGNIFNLLYELVNFIGSHLFNIDVVNLSLCVVLFTIIIRACLFPLNFKQQRSTKVMAAIQPEINKATKKYNNKTDQESIMKKNEESMKIQKKYGVSMTAGCLPMLIQLPAFYGLYRVIQNIPAYVGNIRSNYITIINDIKGASLNMKMVKQYGLEGITSKSSYVDVINAVATDNSGKVNTAVAAAKKMIDNSSDGKVTDNLCIDVLDKISKSDWDQIRSLYNLSNKSGSSIDKIEKMNNFFFGINIADAPGFKLSIALIIPILSAVLQFVSSKISQKASDTGSIDPSQKQAAGMMNTMTMLMPIMSLFICINLPVAIGIYWIIGAVISIVTQLIINAHYKKCDMDEVLEKCKEKAAKKQAKKEAKNPNKKKSFYERMMDAQNGNVSTETENSQAISKMSNSRLKSYTNDTVDEVKQTINTTKYKSGSIGSKANIMLNYQNRNSNNSDKNGGNK